MPCIPIVISFMLIWGIVTCADSFCGGKECIVSVIWCNLTWNKPDCIGYPNPCHMGWCLLLCVLHTSPYLSCITFFRDWIVFWCIEWPGSQHGLVYISSFGAASISFNFSSNSLVQISEVLGHLWYSSCFAWTCFILETRHRLPSPVAQCSALDFFSSSLA